MRGVQLSELHCSVARTLDIVGERWTLLVLRDAFNGKRRFEEFTASLPVARNVLSKRLATLVEHGVLERRRYQERPERFEYRLTSAGRELYPVLIGLLQWGDRHLAGEDGPPLVVTHRGCTGHPESRVVCSECGGGVGAAVEHGAVHGHSLAALVGPNPAQARGCSVAARRPDSMAPWTVAGWAGLVASPAKWSAPMGAARVARRPRPPGGREE